MEMMLGVGSSRALLWQLIGVHATLFHRRQAMLITMPVVMCSDVALSYGWDLTRA